MFFNCCCRQSVGLSGVLEHQQILGQEPKAGVQMQSLIPLPSLETSGTLSTASPPWFLIFGAKRSVSAELAWSPAGRAGSPSARSEPGFAQRQILGARFCSCALPTFTELLQSEDVLCCPLLTCSYPPWQLLEDSNQMKIKYPKV